MIAHFTQLKVICREGNGTPLQYSCLENPMDGGAWWAAVHEVAKSRTQLQMDHQTIEGAKGLLQVRVKLILCFWEICVA